ncbi:hypothetical protein SBF1_9180004 [Candidatus Desulfosporosinus infrequens]|uniref:Uncharacterized protein n=1 Tax=Candidatus Desulfosporosinus infrequens TaxID=2043169 RepID=A0A2U3LX47_9FIRM|nr:hypothetical protein SBF1_9180004 [Candidatus Desulfosporosinus infrequens]
MIEPAKIANQTIESLPFINTLLELIHVIIIIPIFVVASIVKDYT